MSDDKQLLDMYLVTEVGAHVGTRLGDALSETGYVLVPLKGSWIDVGREEGRAEAYSRAAEIALQHNNEDRKPKRWNYCLSTAEAIAKAIEQEASE